MSVFFFIVALIFLIGCTFETCGTKQEKGCCLRSTSATVYGVYAHREICDTVLRPRFRGTWIAILGVVLIAAAAALLAILAGNTANLVCDPLRRPMQRSDMVAVSSKSEESQYDCAGV